MSNRQLEEMMDQQRDEETARNWGITMDEFSLISFNVDVGSINHGELVFTFDKDSDPDVLAKIGAVDFVKYESPWFYAEEPDSGPIE